MPWNGKGYYCDSRCAPDISQAKWSVLIQEKQTLNEITEWLQNNGFTHILVSWDDIDYFTIEHDPQNIHREAASFLLDVILPNCAKEIYADEWVQLYKIESDHKNCQ